MKKINILLIVTTLYATTSLYAQQGHPLIADSLIGTPCPDISLKSIINYDRSEARISDFRGKLLILDFWATWCGPCVSAIPKMDSLQRRFADQLQILMVSSEDKAVVNRFYERVRKQRSIVLPSVTGENELKSYFKYNLIPYYIVVDAKGIIRAIPPAEAITAANIENMLRQDFKGMAVTSDKGTVRYNDFKKSILEDETMKNASPLYYSILLPYDQNLAGSYGMIKFGADSAGGKITLVNADIGTLFLAAFGSWQRSPSGHISSPSRNRLILEVRDSIPFIYPLSGSSEMSTWSQQHKFIYEMVVPSTAKSRAHELMQRDLEALFGYEAKMEKRVVTCLVLKKLPGWKGNFASSPFQTKLFDANTYFVKMRNYPLDRLVYFLERKFLAWTKKPVIDETGINFSIDLDINGKIDEPLLLAKALRETGLDLVEEQRLIDMLVIRDAKQPTGITANR